MRLFSQDTKVEALKRAALFEGLSRKELTQLARVSEDLEIPKGAVLTKEGDLGHEFFVILEGQTEVKRKGKSLGTRGAGDFIGEIALLEQIPRTATVTAKTPLRVFVLTSKDFHHLLEENPNVERKVLRTLAKRVADLSGDPAVA
ncbi:MAG: cyclic nucleotide-binding domain-containing protein [Thermoleophilaceae bacterium]